MSFIADKQTLEDLNLLGKFRSDSMFTFFNQVSTAGGGKLLEELFRHPLTDEKAINERSAIFAYFGAHETSFPLSSGQFTTVENYLSSGGTENLAMVTLGALKKKFTGLVFQDRAYANFQAALFTTIDFLNAFYTFLCQLDDPENPYYTQLIAVKRLLEGQRLSWLIREKEAERIPLFKLIRYDHLLRVVLREELLEITRTIHHLDVYIAVAKVASEKGFCYATALPRSENRIRINGFRHPRLDKGVTNSLTLDKDSNVLFLTGANMAGKSTLMKSIGITFYLAHMGFPVPAKEMLFSVMDGIYSSINVPDNLNAGYSHFYAEVLRVKTVAEEVARDKDLLVIFDELFKGTNVKDAYDATLAVSDAFAENRNCFFIISTHIIEVGEALKERCGNLQFGYMPTVMEGKVPRYPYQLEPGITTDRHGMRIIENEQILEIIAG